MVEKSKPTLTVRKAGLLEDMNERPVTLAIYDVLLPCRQFRVEHKVAEVGKVSITAEFLLRLLKTVGTMSETDVAAFFGYDPREMSFVLREVEEADFVRRADGQLSLTTTGQGLFLPGSDEPAIFEVEHRSGTYGFDLIALAPEIRRHLTDFEIKLPELSVVDPERVSNATSGVRESFRRFFGELSPSRTANGGPRRNLYSIDSVEAGRRFPSAVRISLTAQGSKPWAGEADLSEWRPDFEVADREAIAIAAARYCERLKVHRRAEDDQAYQFLFDIAPAFLKDFKRKDGLAVERYYREAYGRAGDVRSDRPTVPILGSLFTPENFRRLSDVVGYGLRGLKRTPETIYWLAPQVPHWGSVGTLPEVVEYLRSALKKRNNENGLNTSDPLAMVLTTGQPPRWIEAAFNRFSAASGLVVPGATEILLVPGVATCVLVHAPIGAISGHPVPLGIASFDERVVNRVASALLEVGPAFGMSERHLCDLSPHETELPSGSPYGGDAEPVA